MKRSALIKHLKRHGCELLREGTRHSVFFNPANRRASTVPRHIEIANLLAQDLP
jgi:predicted RNA binding protein YcfA (HicA-like mRNA interferase family)